jgi:ElaB/YqjD/DUF883 family membrane-anchored ribosome-binding protein
MEQVRSQGLSNAAGAGGTSGDNGGSIAEAMNRGREGIAAAAKDAAKAGDADVKALRDDLNSLKETVANFISRATGDAAKSVREVTSSVAGQVNTVAGDIAQRSSNAASMATDQAKTLATEFEHMARRNPLGAMAGAVIIGILIGMMGRRN